MNKFLSLLLLSCVVSARCPEPVQIGDRVCHTACGEDRPGADYTNHHAPSLSGCIRFCGLDPKCKAAAYHELTGYCYLKAAVKASVLDLGTDSIVCRDFHESRSSLPWKTSLSSASCATSTVTVTKESILTITKTETSVKTLTTTEIERLISTVVSDYTITVKPSSWSTSSAKTSTISSHLTSTISSTLISSTISSTSLACINGYNYNPETETDPGNFGSGDPWIGICGVSYGQSGDYSMGGLQNLSSCLSIMSDGGAIAATWNRTSLDCIGYLEIGEPLIREPDLESGVANGFDSLSPDKVKRFIHAPVVPAASSASQLSILTSTTTTAATGVSTAQCTNGASYYPENNGYIWIEVCKVNFGGPVVDTTITENYTACIEFAAGITPGQQGLAVAWNRTSGECTSFQDGSDYGGQHEDVDAAVILDVSESFNGK